ncbi:MAG TPA: alpha/beta hydrolase [Pyrinomonadaceae bacterium]|nr:alpha/beta hydrolase [Pyrinomonadaceae bacterium]
MQARTCLTADGLTLTYYRAGAGGEVVVCLNPPGMSMHFWSSVIEELQADHTVIAFDYRPIQTGESEPADDKLLWGSLIEDIVVILRQERVAAAHLASWGLSAKLALAFCRAFPAATLSLTAFGTSDTAFEANKMDAYAEAVSALGESLESSPRSIDLTTALLKKIGGYAGPTLLASALCAGEECGAVLRLIDLLEMESPMANLVFEKLDTPARLRSYLSLHGLFLRAEVGSQIQSLNLPITIVEGAEDGLASLSAENRRQLSAIPGLVFQTISPATHFVLLERPLKVAHLIADAIKRVRSGDGNETRHVSSLASYV